MCYEGVVIWEIANANLVGFNRRGLGSGLGILIQGKIECNLRREREWGVYQCKGLEFVSSQWTGLDRRVATQVKATTELR